MDATRMERNAGLAPTGAPAAVPHAAVPPLAYRNELKIPLQNLQFADFIQSLHQLGLYPKTAFPDRTINSIYLDTPDFRDYIENVSGIGERCKTRLRWYGDEPAKLALELKQKTNKLSQKPVVELSNPNGIEPCSRRAIDELRHANKHIAAMNRLLGLVPILKVRYDRQYFTLSDQLRMTIDRRQMFWKLYPMASAVPRASPVDVVVEFKFPMRGASDIKKLLLGIPFRVFRHSKYVIGVDTSYG